MSAFYFGPLGSMQPVVVSAGVAVETGRALSEFVSSGGVRYVQRGRAAPRTWQVGRLWQGPEWARMFTMAAHGLLPQCWLYDVAAARENMIPAQFAAGRGAPVVVSSERRNLATNPGFESGTGQGGVAATTGGGSSVAVDTAWKASGRQSVKNTPSGSSSSALYPWGSVWSSMPLMGVEAGKTYTVSATLHLDGPQQGSLSGGARRITSGTGENIGLFTSDAAPNVKGDHRVSLTFTIPAGTTSWGVRLYNGSDTSPVWWDEILLEPGATAGTYFDGSTAGASWEGAPNASVSRLPVEVEVPPVTVPVAGMPMAVLPAGRTVSIPVLAGRLYSVSGWQTANAPMFTYRLGEADPVTVASNGGKGSASFTPPADTVLAITITGSAVSGLRTHEGAFDGAFLPGHGAPCKVAVQDPQRTLQLLTGETRSDYQVTLMEVGTPGLL